MTLPPFAAKILQRRKALSNRRGLVFAARYGNAYARDNLYRSSKRAFETARQELGFDVPDNLPFHTSRRTVLTEIAQVHGIEAASRQGSHSSIRVTERHYVQPDEMEVTDFASALERFGDNEM